ncbi:hypothetical protein, partial [Enterobacter mori]|uniref:hypothetical protein n=1 Tax=Enterobacter mori TaxID=539813 RepID=UPI001B8C1404
MPPITGLSSTAPSATVYPGTSSNSGATSNFSSQLNDVHNQDISLPQQSVYSIGGFTRGGERLTDANFDRQVDSLFTSLVNKASVNSQELKNFVNSLSSASSQNEYLKHGTKSAIKLLYLKRDLLNSNKIKDSLLSFFDKISENSKSKDKLNALNKLNGYIHAELGIIANSTEQISTLLKQYQQKCVYPEINANLKSFYEADTVETVTANDCKEALNCPIFHEKTLRLFSERTSVDKSPKGLAKALNLLFEKSEEKIHHIIDSQRKSFPHAPAVRPSALRDGLDAQTASPGPGFTTTQNGGSITCNPVFKPVFNPSINIDMKPFSDAIKDITALVDNLSRSSAKPTEKEVNPDVDHDSKLRPDPTKRLSFSRMYNSDVVGDNFLHDPSDDEPDLENLHPRWGGMTPFLQEQPPSDRLYGGIDPDQHNQNRGAFSRPWLPFDHQSSHFINSDDSDIWSLGRD